MIRPLQLASLWEMLKPYALFFAHSGRRFGIFSEAMGKVKKGQTVGKFRPLLEKDLDSFRKLALLVGLDSVPPKVERIKDRLQFDPRMSEVGREIEELCERAEDELRSREFLYVPQQLAAYYREPLNGWPGVADTYPSAQFDIEEAGRCLALGRHTACVFHLMRVMEIGLRGLAKDLRIPYAPSWESYIKQIQASIDQKRRAKGVRWRRDEPYFTEVLGDLTAIKMAWRNPTMHVRRKYTPDETLDIFNAVRTFMQRLAARENAKQPRNRQ